MKPYSVVGQRQSKLVSGTQVIITRPQPIMNQTIVKMPQIIKVNNSPRVHITSKKLPQRPMPPPPPPPPIQNIHILGKQRAAIKPIRPITFTKPQPIPPPPPSPQHFPLLNQPLAPPPPPPPQPEPILQQSKVQNYQILHSQPPPPQYVLQKPQIFQKVIVDIEHLDQQEVLAKQVVRYHRHYQPQSQPLPQPIVIQEVEENRKQLKVEGSRCPPQLVRENIDLESDRTNLSKISDHFPSLQKRYSHDRHFREDSPNQQHERKFKDEHSEFQEKQISPFLLNPAPTRRQSYKLQPEEAYMEPQYKPSPHHQLLYNPVPFVSDPTPIQRQSYKLQPEDSYMEPEHKSNPHRQLSYHPYQKPQQIRSQTKLKQQQPNKPQPKQELSPMPPPVQKVADRPPPPVQPSQNQYQVIKFTSMNPIVLFPFSRPAPVQATQIPHTSHEIDSIKMSPIKPIIIKQGNSKATV